MSTRPRLLDLFCGAGGCAVGYHRAGFDVVGVDIKPQKHYPFEFHQADALEYCAAHGREFDVIHASPPCQRYSESTPPQFRMQHPDLIGRTREVLISTGLPFVIENVEGARGLLINPVMLCGSMFGMKIFRHRYFELSSLDLFSPFACRHDFAPVLVSGQGLKYTNGKRSPKEPIKNKRLAMGVDWMTCDEITQAIPPAYTEWIGKRLIAALGIDA